MQLLGAAVTLGAVYLINTNQHEQHAKKTE